MKTKLCLVCSLMLVLITSLPAFGEEEIQAGERFFLEVWNDNSFRKTEFGADEPDYTEENYFISELWLQAGLRYELMENLFFDPHCTLEMIGDWGSEDWNKVYWNNSLSWGVGARISYETYMDEEDGGTIWISDFNTELFLDLMFNERSPDRGKDAIPDYVSTENLRTGISLWTAVDTREFFSDTTSFWAEFYSELTFENTGFAEKEFENFYVFSLEFLAGPKFPISEISMQPYYAFNLIRDLGTEDWNREPWLNNITYGPGIRFSMGSLIPVENADLYLYAEYLNIEYLSRVDAMLYEYTADDDMRIGIEIYLPFGATKDRVRRH